MTGVLLKVSPSLLVPFDHGLSVRGREGEGGKPLARLPLEDLFHLSLGLHKLQVACSCVTNFVQILPRRPRSGLDLPYRKASGLAGKES